MGTGNEAMNYHCIKTYLLTCLIGLLMNYLCFLASLSFLLQTSFSIPESFLWLSLSRETSPAVVALSRQLLTIVLTLNQLNTSYSTVHYVGGVPLPLPLFSAALPFS